MIWPPNQIPQISDPAPERCPPINICLWNPIRNIFRKTIEFQGFPHSSVVKYFTCNSGDPGSIPVSGRSAGEGKAYLLQYSLAFLVAQLVNNPSAMWKTWVWSLGWVNSPGEAKGYPLQYSGLENSMACIVHRVTKSQTWLSDFHFHTVSGNKISTFNRTMCRLS